MRQHVRGGELEAVVGVDHPDKRPWDVHKVVRPGLAVRLLDLAHVALPVVPHHHAGVLFALVNVDEERDVLAVARQRIEVHEAHLVGRERRATFVIVRHDRKRSRSGSTSHRNAYEKPRVDVRTQALPIIGTGYASPSSNQIPGRGPSLVTNTSKGPKGLAR